MRLVCTEFYACRMRGDGGGRGPTSATAHEAWLPVQGGPGVHAVRVAVPADAPFSYDGELLSFSWELVARGRRRPAPRRTGAAGGLRSSVSPVLELSLDREHYAPGDTVRGTIRVVAGDRSRSLEVMLNYNEKTDDYAAVAASVSSGPLNTGDLTTGMSFGFELALHARRLPELPQRARRAVLGSRRQVGRVGDRHPRAPPDRRVALSPRS